MLITLLEQSSQMLTEINFEKTKNQFFKKLVERVIGDDSFWDEYNKRVDRENRVGENDEYTEQDRLRLFQYAYYRICSMDPTHERSNNPNAYTLWLIQKYVGGGIKLWEDLSTAKELLASYDKYKLRKVFQRAPGGKRYSDVGTVKSIADLFDAIKLARGWLNEQNTSALSERFGQYLKWQEQDGVRFVYPKFDPSDVEAVKNAFEKYATLGAVIELLTVEASVDLFAGPTAWCTARDGNTYFNHYQNDGPLYVLDDVGNSHLYQIHMATEQFLDERDNTPDDWTSIPILLLKQLPYELAPLIQHARGGGPKTPYFDEIIGGLIDGINPGVTFQRLIPKEGAPSITIHYGDIYHVFKQYYSTYEKSPSAQTLEAWVKSDEEYLSIGNGLLYKLAYDTNRPLTPDAKEWTLQQYVTDINQMGINNSIFDEDVKNDLLEAFIRRMLDDPQYMLDVILYSSEHQQTFQTIKSMITLTQEQVNRLFRQIPAAAFRSTRTARIVHDLLRFLNPSFRHTTTSPLPDMDVLKSCVDQILASTSTRWQFLDVLSDLYGYLMNSDSHHGTHLTEVINLEPLVAAAAQAIADGNLSIVAGERLTTLLAAAPASAIHLFTPQRVLSAVAWETYDKFYHLNEGIRALLNTPLLLNRTRKALLDRMIMFPDRIMSIIDMITRSTDFIKVVNTAFVKRIVALLGNDPVNMNKFAANHLAAWISTAYYPTPPKINKALVSGCLNATLMQITSRIDKYGIAYGFESPIRKIDQLMKVMVQEKYPIDIQVMINIAVTPGGIVWLLQFRQSMGTNVYPSKINKLIDAEELWQKPDGQFGWIEPPTEKVMAFLNSMK